MRLALEVTTAQAVTHAFHVAPQIVMEELETAMGSALQYLKRETIELTPKAFGLLRRAYDTHVYPSPLLTSIFGELTNSLPYALPVELGTAPHFPPLEPLITWVEVKLGIEGDEAEGVARAIQRKIGRFGTPGYGMARHALIDGQTTIEQEFRDALERIVLRVAAVGGTAS